MRVCARARVCVHVVCVWCVVWCVCMRARVRACVRACMLGTAPAVGVEPGLRRHCGSSCCWWCWWCWWWFLRAEVERHAQGGGDRARRNCKGLVVFEDRQLIDRQLVPAGGTHTPEW